MFDSEDHVNDKIKVCIVSSIGGHLTEVRSLLNIYSKYKYFYVLNDKATLPSDMVQNTYFIYHSERDIYFLLNLFEAWVILRKEKPTVLLSTGAGPIVPFALIGKILGIPNIFIESAAQVRQPSLTGRIMYYLADEFIYQWESMRPYYSKGKYGGLLF